MQVNPDERGPLSYLARYVVSKLHKTCVKSTDKNYCLFCETYEIPRRTYSFISGRTRGGLVTRCDDLVGILEIAEISFRQKLNESEEIIRSIPIENINLFDNNELFTSEVFVGKYYYVSRCQSSTTQTLLLGIVIRLYLKV